MSVSFIVVEESKVNVRETQSEKDNISIRTSHEKAWKIEFNTIFPTFLE